MDMGALNRRKLLCNRALSLVGGTTRCQQRGSTGRFDFGTVEERAVVAGARSSARRHPIPLMTGSYFLTTRWPDGMSEGA